MSRILAHAASVYGTLKDATRRLLDAVGGLDHAVERCRLNRTRLSQCGNPYGEGDYLPVDVALQLERAAGVRPITDHFCAAHGGVFMTLPSGAALVRWEADLAGCAKESAEVFARLATALADGKVDRREAADLLRETDEALAAFALLRQHLAARLAADGVS